MNMDFSLFSRYGSTRVNLSDVEDCLDDLRKSGHLSSQQYQFLEGGAKALAQDHSDRTISGDQIHRWMSDLRNDTNDYGIDSYKVSEHIGPILAELFEPSEEQS